MKDQKIIPTFWIENSPYNWENLGSGQSFRYEKGQTLFLEGTQMNHIYLIKQGKVKLSITNSNGDEKTVGFLEK